MINKVKKIKIDKKLVTPDLYTYMIDLQELFNTRIDLLNKINENYFATNDFNVLMNENNMLYGEIQIGYDKSYANPIVANHKIKGDISMICSWLYYEVIMSTQAIFQGDLNYLERIQTYIITFYDSIINNKNTYMSMVEVVNSYIKDELEEDIIENYHIENFNTKILDNVDLNDLRYLFRYGIYISDNEVAYAKRMQALSEEQIKSIAKQMVDGYQSGFVNRNKVISKRDCNRIVNIVGLEKISQEIRKNLCNQGQIGFIGNLVYKNINPQAIYDHRNDEALFLSKYVMENKSIAYEVVLNSYKDDLIRYRGNIIMVSFGQTKLETKEGIECKSYTKEQLEWMTSYELEKKVLFEKYVPKSEISFTGMAFPVKDIHSDYERIFNDIMKINLMNSERHEEIHEKLINELDQGKFVKIKGYKGNQTDITISLPKILNPDNETNFVNCGADINHPVGEVFTSPKLEGTNGFLHIKQARISKIAFLDIRVNFKDGFVQEYSCKNTNDEQKNRELMDEIIFHHRKTLPIGEFALGTNTYAYALAKKDGILYKLHTLIYEKLGPHIAIGDTCFAWSEDNVLISMHSGKEIVAKDNAVSSKRNINISEAYTGVHYDLTIPYDEIYSLEIHKYNGEVTQLVHEGRFVLPGCEYLNEPLDKLGDEL